MEKGKKNVIIVGGTHGNEYLGAYLIKKWQSQENKILRKNILPHYELGNPKAFELGRRYVDKDLNRCFARTFLKKVEENKNKGKFSDTYEENLALRTFHKFKEGSVDFVIDLHTTTSNMGPTIIVSHHDALSLKTVHYLKKMFPELKVICDFVEPLAENHCLFTIAPSGFLIEFGPVPQGVLKASPFLLMENVVNEALKFLDNFDNDCEDEPSVVETFHVTGPLDYPRDEGGDLRGMIHPEREGKDFVCMKAGDPLFLCFNGETLFWEGVTTWPIFINEAAYYEKGTAMILTEKKDMTLREG